MNFFIVGDFDAEDTEPILYVFLEQNEAKKYEK